MEGVPTHAFLTELNGFLNACSASVHCNLGNGTVGYLIITAQPAAFAIACPTNFIRPVNPGMLTLPDPAPAAAVIGTLTRQHAEDLRVFNEFNCVDKACKKVLAGLVPDAYFRSFKNKYTGYANVTCLTILTHLWETYGALQDYEVQENDAKMKSAITAETIFEDFVEQIETSVAAVATQVPYTPAQIVSIAFTLVEKAGIYYDGVKEWRRKSAAEKTWDAFKVFFAREFREVRTLPRTSAAEGYAAYCGQMGFANAAMIEELQQQQTNALANLATATAADRATVHELSSSNTALTAELRAATRTIATLQNKLASCSCAETGRGQQAPPTGPPRYQRPSTGAPRRQQGNGIGNRGQQGDTNRDMTPLNPEGYCWSHGYRVSMTHNGYSCTNRLPGHQCAATRADPMGGSTKNKPE